MWLDRCVFWWARQNEPVAVDGCPPTALTGANPRPGRQSPRRKWRPTGGRPSSSRASPWWRAPSSPRPFLRQKPRPRLCRIGQFGRKPRYRLADSFQCRQESLFTRVGRTRPAGMQPARHMWFVGEIDLCDSIPRKNARHIEVRDRKLRAKQITR